MPAKPAVAIPINWVRLSVFHAASGYSPDAVQGKIRAGVWIEGREFKYAPDGHILVSLSGFERWVEGQSQVA